MTGEFWFLAAIVGALPLAILIAWAFACFTNAKLPAWMLFDTQLFHRLLWPLPIAWLVLFGFLLVRARWVLGFWPYPGHVDPSLGPGLASIVESPLDPKTFLLQTLVLWFLLVPSALSGFVVGPAHLLLALRGMKPNLATTAFSIAGWVLLWMLLTIDPGGFLLWFAD